MAASGISGMNAGVMKKWAALTAAVMTLTALGTGCESLPDTEGSGVILGSDGWLFSESEAAYSELEDYTGESLFSEEELESILTTIKAKRSFFAKTNTDLILILVPDKMSVYSDRLPEELQAQKASTSRLKQVYDIIKKNTRVTTVDLSTLFSLNSSAFDLYDRTGTDLSDMGAYLAYTEIIKAVQSLHLTEFYTAPLSDFDMTAASESGLELAQRLGVEENDRYRNKSLVLTYKGALPYRDEEYTIGDGVRVTEIPEENRLEGVRYAPVMLYGSAQLLEKIQPFTSLSFKRAGYSEGYVTDAKVTTDFKPSQAVMVLYEHDLDQLLENHSINEEFFGGTSSGASGESQEPVEEVTDDDPTRWKTPQVTGMAFASSDRFVIVGTAESGVTVHAVGGSEEVSYTVTDGLFLLDIPISGKPDIILYASGSGMKDSKNRRVSISKTGLPEHYKGVVVGREGALHIDATMYDYLGSNAYSDAQAQKKVASMEQVQEKIRKVSPDTKLIYLVAPNQSTIYPETMPLWLSSQRSANATSKLEQITKFAEGADVTFINPTQWLLDHKDNEFGLRIYNKTDTHWNELGAYYAYQLLMNDYIAPDFPAAAATPIDQFDVFSRSVRGGDMLNYLGVNLDECRENGVFVRRKTGISAITGYDKPYDMNFDNIWTSNQHVFKSGNEEQPSMLMYRDSFSSNMMDFMADSFSKSNFAGMWGYSVSLKDVERLKPDYVIVEIVERNIDSLGT